MHEGKTLAVTATDVGGDPEIIMTIKLTGPAGTECWATKQFGFEAFAEVRDIIGWASVAFLAAADELGEDGWQIFHSPECTEAHLAVTDA